jgi:hypothetical protein
MVSFTGSFHGRTLGALALTYKDQYKTPFAPIMPGAVMVPYLDLEAAAAVIQKVIHAAYLLARQPILQKQPASRRALHACGCSASFWSLLAEMWLAPKLPEGRLCLVHLGLCPSSA